MALREITVTARDGRVSQLEQVYIRGSMVSVVFCKACGPVCVVLVLVPGSGSGFPCGRRGEDEEETEERQRGRRACGVGISQAGPWAMEVELFENKWTGVGGCSAGRECRGSPSSPSCAIEREGASVPLSRPRPRETTLAASDGHLAPSTHWISRDVKSTMTRLRVPTSPPHMNPRRQQPPAKVSSVVVGDPVYRPCSPFSHPAIGPRSLKQFIRWMGRVLSCVTIRRP